MTTVFQAHPEGLRRLATLALMFGATMTLFAGAALLITSAGFLREDMVAGVPAGQRALVAVFGLALGVGAIGITRWRRSGLLLALAAWVCVSIYQTTDGAWLAATGFHPGVSSLSWWSAIASAWLWRDLH